MNNNADIKQFQTFLESDDDSFLFSLVTDDSKNDNNNNNNNNNNNMGDPLPPLFDINEFLLLPADTHDNNEDAVVKSLMCDETLSLPAEEQKNSPMTHRHGYGGTVMLSRLQFVKLTKELQTH